MGADDEIVDAEIIEDDSVTVELSPQPQAAVVVTGLPAPMGPVEQAVTQRSSGIGFVAVPLNDFQRSIVREALGHYHDHGPRDRHTAAILAVLQHVASYDAKARCPVCRDSGSYRTMYREEFCSCTAGVLKRKGIKRP